MKNEMRNLSEGMFSFAGGEREILRERRTPCNFNTHPERERETCTSFRYIENFKLGVCT